MKHDLLLVGDYFREDMKLETLTEISSASVLSATKFYIAKDKVCALLG